MVAGAHGQDEFTPIYFPRMEVARAAGTITIDGELHDAGWEGAARAANFAEHQPGDQVKPPVDTEAFITYDDKQLYVAFACYDDPQQVRASFTQRDRIWNDDYIILLLDTFAQQNWAYEIAVNPYGIQGDLLWSATGGEDLGYDVVFYSAGKITDHGYQVEMAIPFRSLRFPMQAVQEWRVDFWRNHPREVRGQYSWAAYDRDDPCWPCQWGSVTGIRDVQPGKGLELLPAVVASQAGSREEDGVFRGEEVEPEFGMSAKFSLSSSTSLEGTYNPDFSQVESDAAQIDVNTTFALFFPERRPFFQEGSDMFNTYFNTVYTRSINQPQYALKIIGRPGHTNIAILSARDENSPVILPFEESSEFAAVGKTTSNIIRLQRTFGEQSFLGLIGTDRRYDIGGSGTLAGVDGRLRLSQNYHIETQVLASYTVEPNDTTLTADFDTEEFDGGRHTAAFDGESFSGHAIYASFTRNARHWSFDLDYWERSPTFRSDNGFEPRNDQRVGIFWSSYTIWFDDDNVIEWVEPSIDLGRQWNFRDIKKDEWIRANLLTRLKWAQTQFHAQYLASNELFGGILFENIWEWHFCMNSNPADLLQYGFAVNFGHRIARRDLLMGDERSYHIWTDLKPWDRLRLETNFDYIESDDTETGESLFAGYVTRTKLSLQLTRELSLRVVLQYDDFEEVWEADPLITYQINPFSIFYVGSTRDYASFAVEENGPRDWRLTERTYFFKLQYLFQL
jgi:hypothetical protein